MLFECRGLVLPADNSRRAVAIRERLTGRAGQPTGARYVLRVSLFCVGLCERVSAGGALLLSFLCFCAWSTFFSSSVFVGSCGLHAACIL